MEDFVTYEIAKTLKEKGFNIPFYFFYRTDDKLLHHAHITNPLVYGEWVDDEVIIAPTISQVMKWLFDKKQLFVNISCNLCDEFGLFFAIYKKGEETWEACGLDDNYYNKPEEAALAGIEYVLDNLI